MEIKKYQLALTLIFLGMTLAGAIGLNVTPSNIVRETYQTTTTDGVSISFDVYYKSPIPPNLPVIVMGHGVIVNKEMMTNYAMELAAQNFVVASLDWRGHGQSGGTLDTNKLILDLEAVINATRALIPTANWSAIGLIGYSMGGWPTFQYAANHSDVKAWVGVGTTPDATIANGNKTRNVLVVVGNLDEANSITGVQEQIANMTGIASANDVLLGHLYGNIANGTARQIDVIQGADHLMVPWDGRFILDATDWMVRTFYGVVPNLTFMVYQERLILLIIGLIGLVGLVYGVSLILARILKIPKNGDDATAHENNVDTGQSVITGRRFVLLYYAWTLLLVPTAILPGLTFFSPLFMTSFLITLIGCLAINLCFFSWRYLKKQGVSLSSVIKSDIPGARMWALSIAIAAIWLVGFYFIVGLNYLGVIPPLSRLGYIPLYGVILLFSQVSYSIFVDKVLDSFLDRKITVKNEKIRYIAKALAAFLLLYSWFFIIIMLLCAATRSMFLALILILMAPIYLLYSFAGVYLHRLTRSSLPNVLLQTVYLTLLIVTLSPVGSLLSIFVH